MERQRSPEGDNSAVYYGDVPQDLYEVNYQDLQVVDAIQPQLVQISGLFPQNYPIRR